MGEEPNAAHGPHEPEKKVYDLEERTARFGEAIIAFVKRIPHNVVTNPLIGQLVRRRQVSAPTIVKPTTPCRKKTSAT